MFRSFLFLVFCVNFCHSLKLKSSETKNLQKCIQKTIENTFRVDDTVLFINFENEYIFPEVISNPYVMLNYSSTNNTIDTSYLLSGRINSVIHVKGYRIKEILQPGFQAPMLLNVFTQPPSRLYIVVAFVNESNTIFNIFENIWSMHVDKVLVITYDDQNNFKVYYSDRLAPRNNCGSKCIDFVATKDCNSNFTYIFSKFLSKHTNCELYWQYDDFVYKNTVKFSHTVDFVMTTISHFLNMSYNIYENRMVVNLTNPYFVHVFVTYCCRYYGAHTLTITQGKMIWIVPSPRKLTQLEVLKIIFKPAVWLLIVIVFVATSLTWFLIAKCYQQKTTVSDCFVKVFSITLFGSTSTVPKRRLLRFVFIIYVIYSIHVQTGFTSNLIRLLTIPQHKNQIQNVQELVDSNLPVLRQFNGYNWFYTMLRNADKLKTKFKNSTYSEMFEIIRTGEIVNCSIVLHQDLYHHARKGTKHKIYSFVDDSVISNINIGLATMFDSYFFHIFNDLVTKLIESGLIIHSEEMFNYGVQLEENFLTINDTLDDAKIVITLDHVFPMFVFWGIGLTLAVFAFVIELMMFCIKRKKTDRRC